MSDGSDYYKYLQPTTDVVAYAWNAEMVCADCTRQALVALLADHPLTKGDVPGVCADQDIDKIRLNYAEIVLGHWGLPENRLGEIDSCDLPQPVTAGEEGIMEDSCGRCLSRIEDTL